MAHQSEAHGPLSPVLYGVSVGPGDPELLTLKAVRVIERCPVIAAPRTADGKMTALEIARGAVELSGKTILPLDFAMSRDAAVCAAAHERAAALVQERLDAGQDVALLNLGDVSIYATFGSVQAILGARGYRTQMVPGVPSFCAAAARLNRPLTAGPDEPLCITPGRAAQTVLDVPGAKVLMKSGRRLPDALRALKARGLLARSAVVTNCGLPGESVADDLTDYDPAQGGGYFSVILVR